MPDNRPFSKLSDWELAKEITHIKKSEASALEELQKARDNDNNYKDGYEIMDADYRHRMQEIKLREALREKGAREKAGKFNPKPPSNAKVADAEFAASKKQKSKPIVPVTSRVDEKHAMFFDLSSMLSRK